MIPSVAVSKKEQSKTDDHEAQDCAAGSAPACGPIPNENAATQNRPDQRREKTDQEGQRRRTGRKQEVETHDRRMASPAPSQSYTLCHLLWGALNDNGAGRDSQLPENAPNQRQPALQIHEFNVNMAAAGTTAASGNLSELRRLQRLVKRVFDFVATIECEVRVLQHDLQKSWVGHTLSRTFLQSAFCNHGSNPQPPPSSRNSFAIFRIEKCLFANVPIKIPAATARVRVGVMAHALNRNPPGIRAGMRRQHRKRDCPILRWTPPPTRFFNLCSDGTLQFEGTAVAQGEEGVLIVRRTQLAKRQSHRPNGCLPCWSSPVVYDHDRGEDHDTDGQSVFHSLIRPELGSRT